MISIDTERLKRPEIGPRVAGALQSVVTSEYVLGGIGAENKLPGQFALVDLSILNFGIVREGPGTLRDHVGEALKATRMAATTAPTIIRAIARVLDLGTNKRSHRSRSHDAVIRVYDDVGNVIYTHEHMGDFKEW